MNLIRWEGEGRDRRRGEKAGANRLGRAVAVERHMETEIAWELPLLGAYICQGFLSLASHSV